MIKKVSLMEETAVHSGVLIAELVIGYLLDGLCRLGRRLFRLG
jgi:hypothetical protein